jgi:hypothetical protein
MSKVHYQVLLSKVDVRCRALVDGQPKEIDQIRFDEKNLAFRMHLFARRINSGLGRSLIELILPTELILTASMQATQENISEQSLVVDGVFGNIPAEDLYIKIIYDAAGSSVIAVERCVVEEALSFVRTYAIEPDVVSVKLRPSDELPHQVISIFNIEPLEIGSNESFVDFTRNSLAKAEFSDMPPALRAEMLKRQIYAKKKKNSFHARKKLDDFLEIKMSGNQEAVLSKSNSYFSRLPKKSFKGARSKFSYLKGFTLASFKVVGESVSTIFFSTLRWTVELFLGCKQATFRTTRRVFLSSRAVLYSFKSLGFYILKAVRLNIFKIKIISNTQQEKRWNLYPALNNRSIGYLTNAVRRVSVFGISLLQGFQSKYDNSKHFLNHSLVRIKVLTRKFTLRLLLAIRDAKRAYFNISGNSLMGEKIKQHTLTCVAKVVMPIKNPTVRFHHQFISVTSLKWATVAGTVVSVFVFAFIISMSLVEDRRGQDSFLQSSTSETSKFSPFNTPSVMLEFYVNGAPKNVDNSSIIKNNNELVSIAPVIIAKLRNVRISETHVLPSYDDSLPTTMLSQEFDLTVDSQSNLGITSGENSSKSLASFYEADKLQPVDIPIIINSTELSSEIVSDLVLFETAVDENSVTAITERASDDENLTANNNADEGVAVYLTSAIPAIPAIRPKQRPSTSSRSSEALVDALPQEEVENVPTLSLITGPTETRSPHGFRILAIVGAEPKRQALIELGDRKTSIVLNGSVTPFGRVIRIEADGLVVQTEAGQIAVKIGG